MGISRVCTRYMRVWVTAPTHSQVCSYLVNVAHFCIHYYNGGVYREILQVVFLQSHGFMDSATASAPVFDILLK